MAKLPYLHKPPGRDDLYFRRKVPEALRPLFGCGELYKVPLGIKGLRQAAPLLAIANGEFEKKVA